MPAASTKAAANTPPPPAKPDPNKPGTVGVFVPPDNLPEGEERVDSLEGQPWHTINRSRELVEKVQRGEVFPVTLAEFKAKAPKEGEQAPPEGQEGTPAAPAAPTTS